VGAISDESCSVTVSVLAALPLRSGCKAVLLTPPTDRSARGAGCDSGGVDETCAAFRDGPVLNPSMPPALENLLEDSDVGDTGVENMCWCWRGEGS